MRPAQERPGNWGRWGDGDERGALNLVSPDVVRSALAGAAAGGGRVVSLGLPLGGRSTPVVPPRPGVVHTMLIDGGDYAAGTRRGQGGFQFADDYVALPVHTGTHIDALSHVGRHGAMYNGHPTTDVRSTTGARRLGIHGFGGLVTRAAVLDLPATLGVPALEPGFAIEVGHLEAALSRGGVELRPGDAVLLHTGWLDRLDELGDEWYVSEPGLGVEAAAWLAERDVVLIAADNWAIEVVPSRNGDVMPVHLLCLVDHGIYLIELADLRPLAAAGVGECLLVVAPLPLIGGLGSPVNPLAVY